jgi:hypothetical protein
LIDCDAVLVRKGVTVKWHPSVDFAAARLALGAVFVDTMVDRLGILKMDILSDAPFYVIQIGL